MEMWKTAALPMENAFTARWKSRCLSHSPQTPFPTAPPGLAVCPQSHSAYDCCCRKNRKIVFLYRKNHHFMVKWG